MVIMPSSKRVVDVRFVTHLHSLDVRDSASNPMSPEYSSPRTPMKPIYNNDNIINNDNYYCMPCVENNTLKNNYSRYNGEYCLRIAIVNSITRNCRTIF